MRKFNHALFVLLCLVCGIGFAVDSAQAALSFVRLVKLGRYDEARQVLAARSPAKYHLSHLEGLIAKQQGDLALAENYFRQSLAANPDFLAARRELAHTLFLANKYDGAKLHFDELAANADNEAERQSYDQFLKAIRSKRPYGITGFFGVLPSTNVNRGSNHSIFDTGFGTFVIADDSQRQSGIGITAGVSGFYRHDLDDTRLILYSGSLSTRLYKDSSFNTANAVLTTEFGKRHARGQMFFGITGNMALESDSDAAIADFTSSSLRYGLTTRGTYRIDKTRLLTYQASALKQVFENSQVRDGQYYSAFVTLRKSLSPSTSMTIGGGIAWELTQVKRLDHTDYKLTSSFNKQWKGGLVTSVSAGYERHSYKGNFTATSIAREDDRYQGSISLLNPALNFRGFTPKITYTYTLQTSNISFFDYDSHDLGLIFTKKY